MATAARFARLDTDQLIRDAIAKVQSAVNRPYSAEQEARAQLCLAKSALMHAAELRRYNLRCFPGIYRRDRAVCLKSSAALLVLAAKRRRHAAELLAQVPAIRKAA